MSDIQELEARVIALEAVLRSTMLPLWLLVPADIREGTIESLRDTAERGENYYKNRDFAGLIASELHRWVDVLAHAHEAGSPAPA